MQFRFLIRWLFTGVLCLVSLALPGQGTNIEFGQNRVQYKDFTWSFYQSDNFITYFYLGGQDIGKFTAQYAEETIRKIEKMLDYRLNNRIEILVFNDVSDLRQSNIGTGVELRNTGGLTKIIGNKIFVYFNGSHTDLMDQIKRGVAEVFLNNMMFGGNLQEILQNAVLLNLPEWFQEGLISYISEPWSTEMDNQLRDGILSGKYKKFSRLTGDDARFAGHAFWYFVAENYGSEAIPNLLYLTRINRNLENGLLFVLGMTYRETIEAWYGYFFNRYISEKTLGTRPDDSLRIDKKTRKNRHFTQARLSPDGKYLAYAEHYLGAWKIMVRDLATGENTRILKGGFKTKSFVTDRDYPLLAWDPSGRKLVVIYEKRDIIEMMIWDQPTGKSETKDVTKFQKIQSIAFTNDPRTLVLSGINRGQSDIYTFNILSKTARQLTNDFWDDINPHYVNLGNQKGIVFASNRQSDTLQKMRMDTTLPTGHYDLWLLPAKPRVANTLINLTNTPFIDETRALQIDSLRFAFISDLNGIRDLYAGYLDSTLDHYNPTIYYKDSTVVYRGPSMDSLLIVHAGLIDSFRNVPVYRDTAITYPVEAFAINLESFDLAPKSRQMLQTFLVYGKQQFYLVPTPDSSPEHSLGELPKTQYRIDTEKKWSEIQRKEEKKKEETENLDPGYFFQSEFMDTYETGDLLRPVEENNTFRPTAVLPYRVKFSTDYVLSQLDNTILINQYDNFIGNGPVYQNQDISGLITVSISDLMEDYRLTGGFRFPTSLSGSEYFVQFESLRKRFDKKLVYYRRSNVNFYDFSPYWYGQVAAQQKLNYYEATLKYPLDILRSIRGKFALRNYQLVFLATDTFSLELPDYTENWLSARFEYVFDNTYPVDLNILNGMRYNLYFEIQKQVDGAIYPKPRLDVSLGTLAIAGFDWRYYQPVDRNIVWANRIAAATSFGSKKMIYYLGGVDNWLIPRFNNDIEVNLNNNYAFQTLATNLRGFSQNIRNGNSFAVINSELRFPIFSYLINRPIRNEFIRNFQLIGFGDIGTAWEGPSPFDENNPFNTEIVENGPVKIQVKYYKNPIVGGYGIGARSTVFGYFVRVDYAWGVESGNIQKPRWYVALGLDF